jgi:hypothetical protein
MKDLDAASVDDVREFFQTYYVRTTRPRSGGDFDSKEALALVTQYLGRVPKSDKPVPRDIPKSRSRPKETVVTSRRVAAAGRRRRAPHHLRRPTRFLYAANIASKVLSDGESSRIYRKLATEALRCGVRRRTSSKIPTCFLPGRHRPSRASRRRPGNALIASSNRLRQSRSPKPSCSRRRTSSRATTSSTASRTGARRAARARRGHPQRHQDRRRRVRHLHEHRRPTCSAWRRPTSRPRTPGLTIMPKGATGGGR